MNEIEKLIKASKKLKNKEERDEFLIAHAVCPYCLTQTIVRTNSSEKYCSKCGTIIEELEFYYSHGTTKENGDREEIYTPPTNSRSRATVSASFYVDRKVSHANRELFKRLQRQSLYESAKYAESPYTYKSIKQIVSSLIQTFPIGNRDVLIETAMQIYKKEIKKNPANKKGKIKPQILVYLALKKLKISVDYKKYINTTFKATSGLKNKTITNYKNSISKNITRTISSYAKEEKEDYRKYEIEQALKKAGLLPTIETVNTIYSIFEKIIKHNPNLGFSTVVQKIITWKQLEEKRADILKEPQTTNSAKTKSTERLNALNIKENAIQSKIKNFKKIIDEYPSFKLREIVE
jgi:ribosomal protein L37AE/L43A